MTPNNHTSLDLSKAIAESGFEGENGGTVWWLKKKRKTATTSKKRKWCLERRTTLPWEGRYHRIPAYDILNDLCVRYAKEVWGEEGFYGVICGKKVPINGCCCDDRDCDDAFLDGYKLHSTNVMCLLQQGKKQEAEDYIMEHSVLFRQ